MKKKQKQKLLKQFRPNFEQVRLELFNEIVSKAKKDYNLVLDIFIDPKKKDDMTVAFNNGTQVQQFTVPMDENFNTVVKRIQKQEKGLLARFSTNLADSIASYLQPNLPQGLSSTTAKEDKADKAAAKKPVEIETQPKEVKKEAVTDKDVKKEAEKEVHAPMTVTDFTQAIANFPKFVVNQTDDGYEVVEKTPKEERLLATVAKDSNEFTVEKALERKYKLKTEVIPVIEAFAATPISAR
ncbi:hypothetical protein [Enterococcus sp. S86.2]|uniref:hypothetical protein n=1 Tax=Enterococcus sp. S86.2 TaxID=3031299 RepID=UPI0026ED6667|nr:hypothetical protein [Enterococcus sp. S86.2]